MDEEEQLEEGRPRPHEAPILRRHVVVVLVDRLDLAAARAIQYARTLTPDDLRAVHFDIDTEVAHQLEEDWSRLGLSRLPLDIIECPDRRLARAAVELVADAVADGDTECTVLLPRRGFASAWHRLLHDRTADKIAAVVSQVPHVSATIVPYNLEPSGPLARRSRQAVERRPCAGGGRRRGARRPAGAGRRRGRDRAPARRERAAPRPRPSAADQALARRSDRDPAPSATCSGASGCGWPAGSARCGSSPGPGRPTSSASWPTAPGRILLVFQGRPQIPGIEPGARLVAEGMVGAWGRRLAIFNPDYELVAGSRADRDGRARDR